MRLNNARIIFGMITMIIVLIFTLLITIDTLTQSQSALSKCYACGLGQNCRGAVVRNLVTGLEC